MLTILGELGERLYESSLYKSYSFPVSVKLFPNLKKFTELSKLSGEGGRGHHNPRCSSPTPLLALVGRYGFTIFCATLFYSSHLSTHQTCPCTISYLCFLFFFLENSYSSFKTLIYENFFLSSSMLSRENK